MSKKFHVDPSWVLPIGKLQNFLVILRKFCVDQSIEKFRNIMNEVSESSIDSLVSDLGIEEADEELLKTLRLQRAVALCKTASDSPDRLAALCIDCHICVWLKGRKAFVVVFGYNDDFSDFDLPDYAEEHSCWSEGDMPDKMPKKIWKERLKNWSECFDELDSYRLINTVVEANRSIGVSDITKIFSKEIKDAKDKKRQSGLGENV